MTFKPLLLKEKFKKGYRVVLLMVGVLVLIGCKSSLSEDTEVVSEIDQKTHKLCLKAKDYKGCFKANNINSEEVIKGTKLKPAKDKNALLIQALENSISNSEDECFGLPNAIENYCVAGVGKDLLGQMKIKGWLYKEFPAEQNTIYIDPYPKQLKVNNKFGRYLISNYISRKFRPYSAPIPRTTITTGNTTTNCTQGGQIRRKSNSYELRSKLRSNYTYQGTINCKTSSPNTMSLPGKSGKPEGIETTIIQLIIDCKNNEFTTRVKSKSSVGEFPVKKIESWSEREGISKSIAEYENQDLR
jgi:hypothetical protein